MARSVRARPSRCCTGRSLYRYMVPVERNGPDGYGAEDAVKTEDVLVPRLTVPRPLVFFSTSTRPPRGGRSVGTSAGCSAPCCRLPPTGGRRSRTRPPPGPRTGRTVRGLASTRASLPMRRAADSRPGPTGPDALSPAVARPRPRPHSRPSKGRRDASTASGPSLPPSIRGHYPTGLLVPSETPSRTGGRSSGPSRALRLRIKIHYM